MSEHTWFQENLAGYCAGGLSVEEGERFQRHRTACSACAGLLAEAKDLDSAMDNLFAPVRPAAGWENRIIENLRAGRWSPRANWSRWARVAASVAALVVLGGLGAVLHGFVAAGELTFPGVESPQVVVAQNALRRINSSPLNDSTVLEGLVAGSKDTNAGDGELFKEPALAARSSRSRKSGLSLERLGDAETDAIEAESLPRFATQEKIDRGQRALSDKLQLRDTYARNGRLLTDRLNELSVTTFDRDDKQEAVRLLNREAWRPIGEMAGTVTDGRTPPPPVSEGGPADIAPGQKFKQSFASDLGIVTRTEDSAKRSTRTPDSKAPYFTPPMSLAGSDPEKGQPDREKANLAKHELPLLEQRGVKDNDDPSESLRAGRTAQPLQLTVPRLPLIQEKAGQAEHAPEAAPRKIIRTGEMEFEVDGFDAAVAGVTRLVGAIKGAFVTTVNSDKLPNGKVKGSMVVRLPPDSVEKFLLDVRQELAKSGELKSQRIGSQDVSKQYTDVESRLRGARAMEERFLQIIKTGKGEIKDLVIAENALGVWRTKIEEMEGEIRFYNNQVGLATLTITLVEKEIQAPAALVVTERLKIQLEVDDVEKAQQAALAAVAEAKGRVTKSELKQHAAGQLEAILHFEVAPAAADKLRERLKELGIVTHQDADRIEQTEGAGSRAADIKIKRNDVKFEVGMYNFANIQPREVVTIQIASLDVPAGFRKLQEAVQKAKGQVRTGQLNEQDKLNVSAQFDFDVPSAEKKLIDQALAEVGKVISRAATQAAPGEAATDRKIGYRLVLRNVAALPSREKVSFGIEVKDVDQTVADILDMVNGRQGHVAGAQMNHERNGRTSAILVFDVPLSAKDELIRQLKTAGTVRLQTSTRNATVPDNELATAHIDVTLTTSGPIVPSDEGLWPQIRTSLFYSFKLLSWSLMFVILGFMVILPWVLVLWGAYKVVSKWRKKPAAGPV